MSSEYDVTTNVTGIFMANNTKKSMWTVYATNQIHINMQNSSFKGIAAISELELFLYNYKKPADQRLHFNVIDQKMSSFLSSISFHKNSFFLYSTLHRKVRQLNEGGFFDHWLKHYTHHNSMVEEEIEKSKVVLTWDHLYVGFTLWFGLLMIAALIFIVERMTFHVLNYFHAVFVKNTKFEPKNTHS